MHLPTPDHGMDTMFFGIPLIGLLVFGYFRLDEVFARKKKEPEAEVPVRRTRIGYIIEDESELVRDPDDRR